MGIIGKIELASNLNSLASGQIPTSAFLRLVPIFFKRKGLTKAQLKKLMMRRRRMFVDTVIMRHKEMHDKNRELIIEQTKNKISGKASSKIKPQSVSKLKSLVAQTPDKSANKWRAKAPRKPTQHTVVRGAVDAGEKQKSRSKWTVRVNERSGSAQTI